MKPEDYGIGTREIKFRVWTGEGMCYSEDSPSLHDFFPYDDREEILMQYTGLKDKNEKEVWEGDIVKHEGKVMVVPFAPGHVLISKEGAENLDVFVVGNIFENPNLLEK